jgi:hypothetical protein
MRLKGNIMTHFYFLQNLRNITHFPGSTGTAMIRGSTVALGAAMSFSALIRSMIRAPVGPVFGMQLTKRK